jgi:hypothetical protein
MRLWSSVSANHDQDALVEALIEMTVLWKLKNVPRLGTYLTDVKDMEYSGVLRTS